MDEYIKKLLEQVRFQKAHEAIGDEIRSHIEDQIETNISEGMDRETAEKSAVKDMGDPIETGIELDKVHRPQVAWGVIIAAIGVGVFGIVIKLCLSKAPSSYTSAHNIIGNIMLDQYGWYIYNVVRGIAVMLILYLIDYTTVARYSKIVTVILLFSYTMSTLIYQKMIDFNVSHSEIPDFYNYSYKAFKWSGPMMFLIVPLYAGIIYKYKGQKYKGLAKSLLWIVVIGWVAKGYYQEFRSVVIVICLLAELTIAIKKEWIKIPKVQVIASIWSLFAVVPLAVIRYMYDKRLLNYNRMDMARSFVVPDVSRNNAKEIFSGVKAFGSGSVSYMGGKLTVSTSSLAGSSNFHNIDYESYMITKIAAVMGGAFVLAVIFAVAALIVFGFVTTAKTKNQLGIVMGSGCMMWLMINAILNFFVSLGMMPSYQYTSFFPFIATHKVVASYALLGIILSIYKYKNAYPQHIDISFCSKSKDLES